MSGLWGAPARYIGEFVGGPMDGQRYEPLFSPGGTGRPRRLLYEHEGKVAIYEPTDTPIMGDDLWNRGTILFMGLRDPENDFEREFLNAAAPTQKKDREQ